MKGCFELKHLFKIDVGISQVLFGLFVGLLVVGGFFVCLFFKKSIAFFCAFI